MIKVLIFAYDFPPYNSIGGQRPYSWYKYLPEYDIHPIVITRHWDIQIKKTSDFIKPSKNQNVQIIEEENRTIIRIPNKLTQRNKLIMKYGMERRKIQRKVLSLYHDLFQFIWTCADLKYQMYLEAKKYIQLHKVDFIIATAEPWILHSYGYKLHKEFNIPWIADYRDGWTANQSKLKRSFIDILRYSYFRKFERKFSSNAMAITVASPTYAEDLIKQVKINHNFKTIFNGYDDEYFVDIENIQQSDKIFELAYAGRLYKYQNWRMFLRGFKKFIDKYGNEIKCNLVFYGLDFYPDQKKELLNFIPELAPYIKTTERLPYSNVIKKLRKANLLLLFSKKNTNWLSAKLFDYLALNRKILLVENDNGILEKILKDCNGGLPISSENEVYLALNDLYQEWLVNNKIEHKTRNFEQFSRKYQAKILSDFIKSNNNL